MTSNQIIAIFLTVSATALGIPAHASAADDARRTAANVLDDAKQGAKAVGELASDAFITSKVKAALVRDDSIKALDIGVKTIDNVVYLSGRVDTPEQRETAERLAKEVKDVKAVVNHIQLKS